MIKIGTENWHLRWGLSASQGFYIATEFWRCFFGIHFFPLSFKWEYVKSEKQKYSQ